MKRGRATFGMREQVNEMVKKCWVGNMETRGPFTICELVHEIPGGPSICGTGIARLGNGDSFNSDIGERIAKLRAAAAILYKIYGREIHHPLMG